MQTLWQDLRYSLRLLAKSPGFTAVAVLTLALGIGANTAIFSVTYGILVRPLPFQNSSQLVQIWASFPPYHSRYVFLTQREVDQIEKRCQSLRQIAEDNEGYARISGGPPPESVGTTLVSGNFLSMLGARPIMGRSIQPGDTQAGHNQVAVLSYKLWQRRFGGDPSILGKTIILELDNSSEKPTKEPFVVIGVLPALFPFPSPGGNELLVPLVPWENNGQVIAIGRLKEGATLAQVNAELQTIAASLAVEYPKRDMGLNLSAGELRDRVSEGYSKGLLVLLGAVSFVLLLACVNVSSLLIARTWERQKEVAVRETLGATRWRLVQQFLSEGGLLSLLGASIGLLFARWGLRVLVAIAPPGTPRLAELRLDWAVAGYTLALSILAAVTFSLVPAFLVSGTGLGKALKGGEIGLGGRVSRRSHALRNLLIVAEVSLSFLLLVGSSLTVQSFSKLMSVNMGFRLDHVLTMWVDFSAATKANPNASETAIHEILDRTRSLPGVKNASMCQWRPLATPFTASVQLAEASVSLPTTYQFASPGFFETLGIPLLAGRPIEEADTKNSPLVAVVNRTMAARYFNNQPLGKRFVFGKDKDNKPIWLQIVGEVGDTRDIRPSIAPKPVFYVPLPQIESLGRRLVSGSLLVRTSMNPLAISDVVREQVRSVDPEALSIGAESLEEVRSEEVAEPRFQMQLLTAFGALGLILATVGIYGVISYTVAQRTHEVGVRIALGARPRDILHLLLGEGLAVTTIGLAIGVLTALGLMRYMQSMLFEVRPTDPFTFICVALLLGLVALVACYIPAHRTMHIDPMVAVRCE